MRYVLLIAALCAGCATLFAAPPAHSAANTLTIQPPSQSATFRWTCLGCPSENDGRLYVGVDVDETYRGAMKFDLSAIPSGSVALDATLEVYHDGQCFRGTRPATELSSGNCSPPHAITVLEVTSPWSPSSRTGDFATAASALEASHVGGSTPEWLSFDVTDLMNDWLSGYAENYGFLLQRTAERVSERRDRSVQLYACERQSAAQA